ncbi:hypothetical protein BCR32DRAFT_247593 [Anaeromyces robustus]|uniref:Dynamin N-terminal domain-containing protein n=1 Tax=Anaeromyces robustus TaxID=1754192 RepID=A0A1Y1WWF2_9FUNG|nr:hypothetical protein BCR32DRAFT_247593 [Anaeromyces robustus]|eukprot:ORX77889.1 hypothetical protein BCR32DRAFT_247593 [Anaeromyces robustus]
MNQQNRLYEKNFEEFRLLLCDIYNSSIFWLKNLTIAHSINLCHENLNNEIISIITKLETRLKRLEDKQLKILVVGNVNTGKSTLINQFINRDILVPSVEACRALSLEITDSKLIGGKEEVHSINNPEIYNPNNPETFSVISLEEFQSEEFQDHLNDELTNGNRNFIIYCHDNNIKEESFLNNDFVNVSFMEIEGINKEKDDSDNLFNKQLEIDFIIFLVRPGEDFTITGKEFLNDAQNKNGFNNIFFIMNRLDEAGSSKVRIERIKQKFLDKINECFPETYKNHQDLVHFISTKKEIENVKEGKEKSEEFQRLIKCLMSRLLKRRCTSKLLPCMEFLYMELQNTLKVLKNIRNLKQNEIIKYDEELEYTTMNYENSKNIINTQITQIKNDYDTSCTEMDSSIINENNRHEDKKNEIEEKINEEDNIIKNKSIEIQEKIGNNENLYIKRKNEIEIRKEKQLNIKEKEYKIIYDYINKDFENIMEYENMVKSYLNRRINNSEHIIKLMNGINYTKKDISNKIMNFIKKEFNQFIKEELLEKLHASNISYDSAKGYSERCKDEIYNLIKKKIEECNKEVKYKIEIWIKDKIKNSERSNILIPMMENLNSIQINGSDIESINIEFFDYFNTATFFSIIIKIIPGLESLLRVLPNGISDFLDVHKTINGKIVNKVIINLKKEEYLDKISLEYKETTEQLINKFIEIVLIEFVNIAYLDEKFKYNEIIREEEETLENEYEGINKEFEDELTLYIQEYHKKIDNLNEKIKHEKRKHEKRIKKYEKKLDKIKEEYHENFNNLNFELNSITKEYEDKCKELNDKRDEKEIESQEIEKHIKKCKIFMEKLSQIDLNTIEIVNNIKYNLDKDIDIGVNEIPNPSKLKNVITNIDNDDDDNKVITNIDDDDDDDKSINKN